jgi:hypothetical protein
MGDRRWERERRRAGIELPSGGKWPGGGKGHDHLCQAVT